MSTTPSADAAPITRLPPTGRKFPCSRCGARLDFDPESRSLKCPYCGHQETIAPSSDHVVERSWDEYWQTHSRKETLLAGHSSQVTCQSCGAVTVLDDSVATDKCPYCGAHLENDPESAQSMIAPEATLPFAVSQREAVEAFNAWI